MTYKEHLETVIDYLNGKVDIYNGEHNKTIEVWNDFWDKMKWQGFEPDTVKGIQKYIVANT